MSKEGTDWELRLPLLGLRASRQKTTRKAPSEILYGHTIRLPVVAEAGIYNHEDVPTCPTGRYRPAIRDALLGRQGEMRAIVDMAIRNIERAAETVRDLSACKRRRER